MSIQAHPEFPEESGCKLLTGFDTGSAVLLKAHKNWLNSTIVKHLVNNPNSLVYIEGFASRNYDANFNLRLSHQRATAVADFLVAHPLISRKRIVGLVAHGESKSGGNEKDNSPKYRSVAVALFKIPSVDLSIELPFTAEYVRKIEECYIIQTPKPTRAGMAADPGAHTAYVFERMHDASNNNSQRARRHTKTAMYLKESVLSRIELVQPTNSYGFISCSSVKMKFTWSNSDNSKMVEVYDRILGGIKQIPRERAAYILENPFETLEKYDQTKRLSSIF